MIGQLRIIAWLASPSVLSYSFLVLGGDQGQSSFTHTLDISEYNTSGSCSLIITNQHNTLPIAPAYHAADNFKGYYLVYDSIMTSAVQHHQQCGVLA